MLTYAIGDIHGCNRTFLALLKNLSLSKGDRLILLGDLIDRGPGSMQVTDTVFHLRNTGFDVICLRGNHEQMLLGVVNGSYDPDIWLINGGRQTLDSFAVQRAEDIPDKYIDFFSSTGYWYESAGFLCVHGGLDFSYPDPLQAPESLLWMRRWYAAIDYKWLDSRIVLHGHTPEAFETICAQHENLAAQQYLNLDNGCVYARLGRGGNNLGRLLGFCLNTRELIVQPCLEG